LQFVFANHMLDIDRRELRGGSDAIAVELQVFRHIGLPDGESRSLRQRERSHLVSENDLIASVWGSRIVFGSTLTNRINGARRAAGDSGDEQKLIRIIASDQVDALGTDQSNA
jgi:DNA-binding winged helix-turn-helix (wHTH) protein